MTDSMQKRCYACKSSTDNIGAKCCPSCGAKENYEYFCTACTTAQSSCSHPVTKWSKRCSGCNKLAGNLHRRLCTGCGLESGFQLRSDYRPETPKGDVTRNFECGHTEQIDRRTSQRRMSNKFCSKCWPQASQQRKEKLYRQPTDTQVRRTRLTPDDEATTVEYFKIHDRVMRYAKAEHGIKLNISSIEKIKNPVLDRRLHSVRSELHKKFCAPELFIHGTSGEAVEKIIQEGFKVGTQGMYGAGIYFATDSTKSAQYCKDKGVKCLLLCEVLLGKSMVCDAPKQDLNLESVRAAGYDSVFARRNTKGTGGVANDEYIVYRPEQATPRYLVKSTTECCIL